VNSRGGESRLLRERPDETVIVRHEEEIGVDTGWRGIGFLRARKHARTVKVREKLPVDFEQLVQERVPVAAGDSGEIETLARRLALDSALEEELVVTNRTVLRDGSSCANRSRPPP
jgi:Domain of unknown function (DUF2382)